MIIKFRKINASSVRAPPDPDSAGLARSAAAHFGERRKLAFTSAP
jgi:hypothetical protein